MEKLNEKEENCCSIDYEHHKEIFERRRRAFLEHPDEAVAVQDLRNYPVSYS